MASSIYIVLKSAVGFRQQLRRHGQVTLGRAQIDVSEISRKGWQKGLDVCTLPVPLRQPVDGERVPQIMEPRLMRTCVAAADTCKVAQPPEGVFYEFVSDGLLQP
jgi:hypothetical protein